MGGRGGPMGGRGWPMGGGVGGRPPMGGGPPQRPSREEAMRSEPYPELYSIHHGRVATVKDFGAFIELPGYKRNGLVHKSQISNHAVEDAQEVLERNEKVWVKVVSIEESEQRLGLSMKYVSQGDGTDLDANHVQASMEGSRARPAPRGKQPVHLEAVFDTKCPKCGGTGHLAFECFGAKQGKREKVGRTYELVEAGSDEDAPLPTAAAKVAARTPGDTQAFLWAMATGGTGPVAPDDVPDDLSSGKKAAKGGKGSKKRRRGGKSRKADKGDAKDADLAKISSLAEAKSVLQMLDEKKEKKRSRGRGGRGRRSGRKRTRGDDGRDSKRSRTNDGAE